MEKKNNVNLSYTIFQGEDRDGVAKGQKLMMETISHILMDYIAKFQIYLYF